MAKSLQQLFLYYIPQLRDNSRKFQKRKDQPEKTRFTLKGNTNHKRAVNHSFHV